MNYFFNIQNLHLHSIVHIIPSLIYAKLQNIFKAWGKISSKNGPLDFRENVVVASAEAMLECVGKIGIQLVADNCLSVCDAIIFCPWIALSNDRNS